MLFSAGHSVRPRPLIPWISQIFNEKSVLIESQFANLNQLALIAYFNGNPSLAKNICSRSIATARVNSYLQKFSIQPWVNLGRLYSSDWNKAREYFLLPHYALGILYPPESCPEIPWKQFLETPSMFRFCWAVFLSELARAVRTRQITTSEIEGELSVLPIPPSEFHFSVIELRILSELILTKKADLTNFNSIFSKKLTFRQLLTRLYLDCWHSISVNDFDSAYYAAVAAIFAAQKYKDSESADPIMNIAWQVILLTRGTELEDFSSRCAVWLNNTAYELNNELLYYQSLPFVVDEKLASRERARTEYKRFNKDATDLSERIEEAVKMQFEKISP